MLMVMAALLLAVLVWLAVVRRSCHGEPPRRIAPRPSAVTLAQVRASVASLGPARPAAQPPAEGLGPLIRRTAEAAGLEVVTAMSPSGQLGFQLSRARSGPLFAWLAALETDHRLNVCALGVVENSDATLNVEGALASGACTG